MIELLKVNADVAQVELKVAQYIEGDVFVKIDKLRTQQILINLIQNAIKYSLKFGHVHVMITKR